MPDDLSDLLLASDSMIEDLMALAKQLPTQRLQVLALAAALAYVAEDGGVPNAFVEKAVKAALRMAKGRGAKPN
jgi:hypothetical protein